MDKINNPYEFYFPIPNNENKERLLTLFDIEYENSWERDKYIVEYSRILSDFEDEMLYYVTKIKRHMWYKECGHWIVTLGKKFKDRCPRNENEIHIKLYPHSIMYYWVNIRYKDIHTKDMKGNPITLTSRNLSMSRKQGDSNYINRKLSNFIKHR